MNLKLFKPEYKSDRQNNLNYCLFGEYMKKCNSKLLFKGGFGGTTERKVMSLKNNLSQIDMFERKLQVNTIIKNYENSIRQRKRSKDKSQLSQSKFSIDKHLLNNQYHNNANKNSFDISTIKQYEAKPFNDNGNDQISIKKSNGRNKNKNKSVSSLNNKSLLPQITTLTNRNTLDETNKQREGIVLLSKHNLNNVQESHKSKIDKYDKTPFAKKKLIIDDDDKYYHFEKLKQLHQFYIKDKSDFDKNKWKMFRKHKRKSSQLVPKHSIHWIQLMMRKDNPNY